MSLDFSTIIWIVIALMALQPLLMGRWFSVRRMQAIRAFERARGSRVITMIHRQEKRSLFGFSVSRHIDLEDAQTIIAAIKETPQERPTDLILHTPGGLVLAAMQIARAIEARPAKVTVFVPVYAMSGGTLIALAADEIVLGEFSVMKALFVFNDPPYGTERVYNALRLAHALAKEDAAHQVTVFLMADAVLAAKAKQKTPDGFYNVERMLKRVLTGKGRVLLCGTCMDARGIDQTELMEGAQRSTMDELAAATAAADKVLVF